MRRTKNPSNKPKSEDPKITWIAGAVFAATVQRQAPTGLKADAQRLGVVVQQDGDAWAVIAFEARAHGSVQAVLDNHAHKVVGQYVSVTEALLSAESYAKAWFKGHKSAQLEVGCECDEIDAEFELTTLHP